ncbi:D-alanyl-D-alanine carboxypeptidase/D-alanyl-D-alanine-endopeptidase [Paucibacter sp. PLA-PC-4]|uniref:D-alanyl-D-alanine carboxypeptidase/D-alanyl-D-alanine endopeptidase n=1 Tax=Paucibacter sp. PLA-PC-4 TaxID=2993655 RepID=UPI00224969C6|nr:D-alanyl-D-alanine carboxypeptidase/D-alanyl-D-alanine-endopeptidase [Paucibacter sp. PLA-PC-4]MCX2860744.1 D-alanyl-D-alanine carboxypeptidase/D-alanyl-D-alanine-endopeptidase [Paucibacter sp. PLA-PC-4]
MRALPLVLSLVAGLASHGFATAQPVPLPAGVSQILRQAQLPPEALAIWIQELGTATPRLAWQADQAMNPASLMKLSTTLAALEILGPAWTWQTPVWLHGRLRPETGVLEGDLVIKGVGDPKLVRERLWLLLQRVRAQGVREIHGHILLDNSGFAPSPVTPADFDGEPWRPGNVQPEALLLNYKSQTLSFRPDPARGLAWIASDVPLPAPASVPLQKDGACGDWRGALRLQWQAGQPLSFAGSYPASCGEQSWPLADADPAGYNARLIAAMWREMGGGLLGEVRAGVAPATPPNFSFASPPLAEVVRDINKYSANLMSEMLWLSLAGAGATPAAAQERLRLWLAAKIGESAFVLENGSGLSREQRLSARQLGRLLQLAHASPVMPEFMASLPVAGADGTLTRGGATRFGTAAGRAHLKTGSLRDVVALGGYVLADSGRRYVLVALINHPRASAARGALDALLQWTVQDLARSAAKP